MNRVVLTIAGSDPSGGAGLQADIKTITAHGMYAMSVITAVTVQNTTGVYAAEAVDPELVEHQLDCVLRDIPPHAVKIGMLHSRETVLRVAKKLKEYDIGHIVLDPVLYSTSGKPLLESDAEDAMKHEMFPLAELITPNLPEAEHLCGSRLFLGSDILHAAERLAGCYGCAVLLKGGHRPGQSAADLLLSGGKPRWYCTRRRESTNTHGTGCTLSSAIACGLAAGLPLPQAVGRGKRYLTGALGAGLNLGEGNGPLDHCWNLKSRGLF